MLMVTTGTGVTGLARGEGAAVLARHGGTPAAGFGDELVAALSGTRAAHVVLLPNDRELTGVAEAAAAQARATGQEVVVVPTGSVLQGLAALAVHDPRRRAGDDVVAMAEAAAGTRSGALVIADEEALTWVGRCQPGDVLALLEDDVVLIESDLTEAGCKLAAKMLSGGGELVTVLLGAGVPDELGTRVEDYLRQRYPEVEVVIYAGGQRDRPLLLGVE